MSSFSSLLVDVLYALRHFTTPIIKLIPKKKNLIIFSAWFGEKYIDNTRFVYEYLLNNGKYEVYWLTNNKKVYQELTENKFPVAYFSSIKGVILQLRAQVCFSTVQFSDFNSWLVCNSIYIDLGHGNMIKDPGQIIRNTKGQRVEKYILDNLFYYAIVPSDYSRHYYQQVVRVPERNIIISDFARNDVFIDQSLRLGKNEKINELKKIYNHIIVYMPTHRSDGKLPLNLEHNLPLQSIQDICSRTNSLFVIKKHFYHREEILQLNEYDNIIDITREEADPQVLLYQADILITDYSSCFIDYLLLHRPIIFYQFDYEYYTKNERSLFIDFKAENFAPVVETKDDLPQQLLTTLQTRGREYEANRERITSLFFNNTHQQDGRGKVIRIMEDILKEH